MVPHYYRNADAVVYVFDVTRRSSFDNVPRWIEELHSHSSRSKTISQIIIGNKCDLRADMHVRTNDIKNVANHYGLPYWETSAKSDLERDTIEAIFKNIAESLKLKTPLMGSNSQSLSGSDGAKLKRNPCCGW